MRRRALMIDLAIALVAMIVLIIISPGLAIVGLIAILVLIACGLSFLIDRRRSRHHSRPPAPARRSPSRRPPPRRPPTRTGGRRPPRY